MFCEHSPHRDCGRYNAEIASGSADLALGLSALRVETEASLRQSQDLRQEWRKRHKARTVANSLSRGCRVRGNVELPVRGLKVAELLLEQGTIFMHLLNIRKHENPLHYDGSWLLHKTEKGTFVGAWT